MVAEPEGKKLSESEYNSITALVFHTAAMMYHCGINLDGMQLGISNDPDGELCWKRDDEYEGRYHISFCTDTFDDWSQTIYQLGYAFTHCVIDYCFIAGRIPWIEETICEMMQIWLLNSFISDWAECELYERDPDYHDHLRDYLHDYLTDQEWTDLPSQCTSVDDILLMNHNAEDHAADRVGTVIHLYYLTTPGALKGLLCYGCCEPGNGTGLIDTKEWQRRFPDNLAVRYLASIQDNAVRNDPSCQALSESIDE